MKKYVRKKLHIYTRHRGRGGRGLRAAAAGCRGANGSGRPSQKSTLLLSIRFTTRGANGSGRLSERHLTTRFTTVVLCARDYRAAF